MWLYKSAWINLSSTIAIVLDDIWNLQYSTNVFWLRESIITSPSECSWKWWKQKSFQYKFDELGLVNWINGGGVESIAFRRSQCRIQTCLTCIFFKYYNGFNYFNATSRSRNMASLVGRHGLFVQLLVVLAAIHTTKGMRLVMGQGVGGHQKPAAGESMLTIHYAFQSCANT